MPTSYSIRSTRAATPSSRARVIAGAIALTIAATTIGLVRGGTFAGAADVSETRQRRDELVNRLAELHDQLEVGQAAEQAAQNRLVTARLILALARDRYRAHVAALYTNDVERDAGAQQAVATYLASHRATLSAEDVSLLEAATSRAEELVTFQTAIDRAEAEQQYLSALRTQVSQTADLIEWYRAILDGRVVTEEALAKAEAAATASASKTAAAKQTLDAGRVKATDDLATAGAQTRATTDDRADDRADDGAVTAVAEPEPTPQTRAAASVTVKRLPRTFSTAAQQAFMRQFPFGPVDGVPAGLARTGQTVSGVASWYGADFNGRPTASGAIYDMDGYTVASKELPLGTILLISRNGRSVLALVNDRGPYIAGRVLDLSRATRNALGIDGLGSVHAEVLAVAS